MVKKRFLKYLAAATLIFGIPLFSATLALADLQVYPKGYGNTGAPGGVSDSRDKCFGRPVSQVEPRDGISYITSTAECGGEGDFFDDTTEPHGAINHRTGQTFYLPEKKVLSRVRFNAFIGAEGQTNGGKVRVVLRQGNGNGPEIASAIAYITGWQYNNWLSNQNTDYCRWHINDPANPANGRRIDNLDGPCLLETADYATSWAVMPFVTPLEINFTLLSPVLPPGKYSVELRQDYAYQDPEPWKNHNLSQGLFNRFNAINQIPAYYQDTPYDDYDAIWDWYWPGPQNGRDLAGLAVYGKAVPQASVTGPATGTVNQPLIVSGTAQDPDGNLTQEEIWVTTSSYTLPTGCSKENTSTNFCLINRSYLSGGSSSFSSAWTPQAAGSYIIQVNAFDSDNLRCTGNPQGNGDGSYWKDTCGPGGSMTITISGLPPIPTPTPIPPLINSLRVNNGATPSTSGTYKVSGLQAADGGSNWLNPINISLSAAGYDGTTNTIQEYYVSFYDQSSRAQATNLSDIQARLNSDPKSGFLIRYSPKTNQYRVWDGCDRIWELLPQTISACSNSSINYYTVTHPSNAMWKIDLHPLFESKNMYTSLQATDVNNTSTFSPEVLPYPTP